MRRNQFWVNVDLCYEPAHGLHHEVSGSDKSWRCFHCEVGWSGWWSGRVRSSGKGHQVSTYSFRKTWSRSETRNCTDTLPWFFCCCFYSSRRAQLKDSKLVWSFTFQSQTINWEVCCFSSDACCLRFNQTHCLRKYQGTVRSVLDFGAFVDIGAEGDGLLHISQISQERIDNIYDVLSEGQQAFGLRNVEGAVGCSNVQYQNRCLWGKYLVMPKTSKGEEVKKWGQRRACKMSWCSLIFLDATPRSRCGFPEKGTRASLASQWWKVIQNVPEEPCFHCSVWSLLGFLQAPSGNVQPSIRESGLLQIFQD